MFSSKRKVSKAVITPQALDAAVKICPSCRSRQHQIENYPNRGVLLPAMDITLCIVSTPDARVPRDRAIESAKNQLLKPYAIHVAVNHQGVNDGVFRKSCLDSVETNYVAFMDERDILQEKHLFMLASELVRTASDCVYSCKCSGTGCDCRTRYLGIAESARTGFLRAQAVEEYSWNRIEGE